MRLPCQHNPLTPRHVCGMLTVIGTRRRSTKEKGGPQAGIHYNPYDSHVSATTSSRLRLPGFFFGKNGDTDGGTSGNPTTQDNEAKGKKTSRSEEWRIGRPRHSRIFGAAIARPKDIMKKPYKPFLG